ncbi:MAG TPA: sodium:calcium antiporter [Acidimicrobiaceae bacterium]|nr:sodium:calcium antiporter [Acidimicrobiaceae bacterium]
MRTLLVHSDLQETIIRGHVLIAIVSLLLGLFVLLKAGDLFVDGAVSLAKSLKMSSVVVGAIVLGFGTSAPELVVSTIAASQGNPSLGVGNIVGSNVANLSLVLGVAALVTPIALSSSVIRRQAPLSIAAVFIFALTVVDGELTRLDGVILLILLLIAMLILIKTPAEAEQPNSVADQSLARSLTFSLLGLGGVLAGAQLAVSGATTLADKWGLSGGFVGFSIVALGTSLPELVTAVAAARKKEAGLIVGNLFGSNLFNGLAGGAAIGLVDAGPIGDAKLTGGGLLAMLGAVAVAYLQGARKRRVGKIDALLLLAIYLAAMLWLGVT